MSTVPPPGTQPPQPPPSTTQAAQTAVIREPSPEVQRLAAGTRVEGTVLPPPSQPNPQHADATRAVQTLQTAADTQRADTAAAQRTAPAPAQPQAAQPAPSPGQPQTTQTAPPPGPQTPALAPQVQIRTPVGDVVLRTNLPLPEGARVAFDIANSNASQVTVRLTSLNGQPIQQALVQLAADRAAAPAPLPTAQPAASGPLAQPPTLAFGQVWTPGGAVNLTQAGPFNAFVLAGTAGLQPTGQPQTPPGLMTGSDLTVRITSATPAAAGTTPPQGALPGLLQAQTPGAQTAMPTLAGVQTPGSQSAVGPAAQVAGTQTSSATGTAQVTGQSVATPTGQTTGQTTGQPFGQGPGQITGQAPPSSTPTGLGALLPTGANQQHGLRLVGGQGWPPAPLTTPSQVQQSPVQLALTGIVTAQSTAAQTVVQTPAGDIQLGSRVNLPPGSTVTLEVLTQAAPRTDGPAGATAQSAAPPPSLGALPFSAGTAWPALTEALQLLQRTDPQAGQLLSSTLPDGGPRTVVAALSFIQAMRAGDPRQWPGDNNLRALERAGPRGSHLARALAGEVAQMGTQVRESAGEWRSTPVPWNANGQVEKINLITRREDAMEGDEDNKTKKGGGAGLRFLVDLDFTQLGEIQLDGMYHEESKGFDMMVRSHETLDDAIRRDLTGLFVAANQTVGLKGGLTFQVTKKFADPIGSSEPMKLERDGVWA